MTHCLYCTKPIGTLRDFCNDDCREAYRQEIREVLQLHELATDYQQPSRKQQKELNYLLYILIGLTLGVILGIFIGQAIEERNHAGAVRSSDRNSTHTSPQR